MLKYCAESFVTQTVKNIWLPPFSINTGSCQSQIWKETKIYVIVSYSQLVGRGRENILQRTLVQTPMQIVQYVI